MHSLGLFEKGPEVRLRPRLTRSAQAHQHACVRRTWLVLCVAMSACTPVGKYLPVGSLRVQVDADDRLRSEPGDIEVKVESRTPAASSWTLVTSQRFAPSSEGVHWPLAFEIEHYDPTASYEVTATLRDDAGAVSIQARAVTDVNLPAPREVRLRLDAECLRRTTLCSRALTCSMGDCVDAREPLRERTKATSSQRTQTAASATPRAERAAACDEDGTRSCDSASETLPLLCTSGSWRPEPECAGGMRCQAGQCVANETQCATLGAGARFCGANGLIYQCQDTTIAMPSPCDDNQTCVEKNGEAMCACQSGRVRDNNDACVEPIDCRDQGGCDPLTICQMANGKRVCTACPQGYIGSGETGCKPQALQLTVTPGTLLPAFDPSTLMYNATAPFLAPRVSVTVDFDVPARLTINEQPAVAGTPWLSPLLTGNPLQLAIGLRTDSGVRTDYQVIVERAKPQLTYLKASNGKMGDQFGGFVAAYGDTVVVGAPYETRGSQDPTSDTGTLLNAGAAYVFVRDANGGWREQGYLKAEQIQEQDYFGSSVSIWKDHIAVGAPGDLVSSVVPGAANGTVYVFVRDGDKWTRESTIRSANNVANGDSFGFRVALRENTLLVGAPLDDNGATRSGSVYVYEWDGAKWENMQRLKAMPPVAEARYGSAIELDEQLAVVGSFQESHGGLTRPGAAYAYTRGATEWTLLQRLVSPMAREMAHFGATLAIDGKTIIVTAPHNPFETMSTHAGEAYVFAVNGAKIDLVQMLSATTPVPGDEFASSVALRNGLLLLSAPNEKTIQTPHGAAYLFAQGPSGFTHSHTLAPASVEDNDLFGYDVALTDKLAVIAAPSDDSGEHGVNADASDNSVRESGAVYIFE